MTREEAIERLDLCQNVCNDCLTCASHDEALDMAIAALREQDSNANQHVSNTSNALGGWNSVEERLPEKNTIVLCYKNGQWRLGYYIGAEYCKGVAAFRHPKDQFAFGVTHWMPLPEPPKEEV